MTSRFDNAWAAARALASTAAKETHLDIVLVRDVIGRVSLVMDDSPQDGPSAEYVRALTDRLTEATKPFIAPAGVMLMSTMFDPAQVFQARDLVRLQDRTSEHGRVSVLERGVVGAEWLHPRLNDKPTGGHRVTLYGFKGGVGRSSATFMLAQHLASHGKCVLVVDLDLESPGVSSLLQEDDDLPDYGIVDYIAESAVDNAVGLDLVTKSQTVRVGGNGEVWVAPAGGRPRDGYDYLAKLNRAYLDLPASITRAAPQTLASRLESAVGECERRVWELSRQPEITLLDSRAGIHDIAAIAITQLAQDTLLFATDSPATWNGYRELFQQWGRVPARARAIRDRLRMVAAMVPRDRRDAYLEEFRDHAQSCFAATLYDDVLSGNELDATASEFNFAPDDEDAPHNPLPIYFAPDLVAIDTAARRNWHEIDPGAYTAFLEGATVLIVGDQP
jgi:hypothetical protein